MDVIISKEAVDLQESDLLIATFFQDERPLRGSIGWVDWRLNGMLSRLLIENKLKGEWKERILIPSEGRISSRLILLFGLGEVRGYSYLTVREIMPFIMETLKNLNASRLCLSLPFGEEYHVDCGKLTLVLLEGITDRLDQYPSDREWIENLTLSFGEGEERFSEILYGIQTAKSTLKDRLQIRILTPSDSRPKVNPVRNV
ncbi:MAG: hypothetical protein FJ110_03315 [Deltaproteobacteria bacterium]|nr:hypothetical protein [Deltaproteobacteria bacterium]